MVDPPSGSVKQTKLCVSILYRLAGAATLGSGLDTIRAVMNALEAGGVELLNHGQPGVRFKAK
jgi:hypothetical protein